MRVDSSYLGNNRRQTFAQINVRRIKLGQSLDSF